MTLLPLVKPVLFALLGGNAVIYALAGRGAATLDAAAWFALLLLFEIEVRRPSWSRRAGVAILLDVLRFAATIAVMGATAAFVQAGQWLDAANGLLWIGVVILLELDVRAAAWVAAHHRLAQVTAALLYGCLAAVALAWLARGEWFDGYDALLWIAAFALIERDLLQSPAAKASA